MKGAQRHLYYGAQIQKIERRITLGGMFYLREEGPSHNG